MIAELKRLLAPLLARRLRAQERRELAAALRAEADRQEQLASADARVGHQLRRAALDDQAARQRTGRPRGSGARWVRWEPRIAGRTGQLYVGRALWQELDEPARLDVQRLDGRLVIVPCGAGVGWACIKPSRGMPHLSIGDEAADALRLAEGRWPAEIRGGAIWC